MTEITKNMTMNDYLDLAKEVIANMIKTLPEPIDTSILVLAGEKAYQIVLEGEATNSSTAKSNGAALAKKLVNEKNAHAVLVFGDMWFTETERSNAHLIELVRTLGVNEADRLGLVKKREALWCNIETRTQGQRIIHQFYRRDNNGDIVIEEEWEPKDSLITGRMFDFFPKVP